MIQVGDIAPRFELSGTRKESVNLDDATIAGRFILLLFASPGRVNGLSQFEPLAESLREGNALVYTVAGGELAGKNIPTDLSFPVLADVDRTVSDGYGIEGSDNTIVGVLLAPNQHVCAVCTDAANLASDVSSVIERARCQWQARASDHHPPVLVVPDVFSADDCKRLISVYRLQGNRFIEPGHGDQATTDDYKMRIPEYGRHDRVDHWIMNPDTNRLIDDRLRERLFPEIHKAFQYRITRREHFRIGCYEGERGGDLNGHRDNTEPAVAHRRFAVSINLNTEAFSGGEIQFLEYGGQGYRPASGAAIVFSSSLLHEILEVSEGRRYVLLAFLYGET